MECPIEMRIFHPWVRVFTAYAPYAANWVSPKKKVNLITDIGMNSNT